MPKSEIFEDYIKIMSGLTKTAEHKPTKEQVSSYELLYGVKPEEQDYEYNIIEKAHPKSVVVFPAHDKMNGVVENVNERQNVMVYIARNKPTGNNTQHIYAKAKQDLTKELLKAANILDLTNKPEHKELMELADKCADQVQTQFIKLAFPWIPVLVVAGITYIAATQHMSDANLGAFTNLYKLDDDLTSLTDDDHWYRRNLRQDFKDNITKLKTDIGVVYQDIDDFQSIYDSMVLPPSLEETAGKDLSNLDLSKQDINTLNSLGPQAQEKIKKLQGILPRFIGNLEKYKQRFSDPSFTASMYDKGNTMLDDYAISKLWKGPSGLLVDKFGSVVNRLEPTIESLNALLAQIKTMQGQADRAVKGFKTKTKAKAKAKKPGASSTKTETTPASRFSMEAPEPPTDMPDPSGFGSAASFAFKFVKKLQK